MPVIVVLINQSITILTLLWYHQNQILQSFHRNSKDTKNSLLELYPTETTIYCIQRNPFITDKRTSRYKGHFSCPILALYYVK